MDPLSRLPSLPPPIPSAEAISPRILYSADAAVFADPIGLDYVESEAVESSQSGEQHQAGPALVVIDQSLESVDDLIGYLDFERSQGASIDWLLLESDRDGVLQVSEALAQSSQPYDAIHIISHGAPGQFDLGSSQVSAGDVSQYAQAFSSWRENLTEQADILIYACDVSASEQGQELAENLALLTGADVATSNNLTGHRDLGGDWDLEQRTGAIETSNLLAQGWSDQWLTTLALDPVGIDIDVPADPSGDEKLKARSGGTQIATNGTTNIVVWRSDHEVHFRRFQTNGVAIDATDQVVENLNSVHRRSPVVAIAANGEFVIAWKSNSGQDGDAEGIFAQRFNADGTIKSRPTDAYSAAYSNASEFLVTDRTDGKQELPSIAIRDDGVFVISWTGPHQFSGQEAKAVLYSVFNADGTRMQAETPASLSNDNDEDSARSAVAINPVDGSMVVAYETKVVNNSIQLRRLSANGQISGDLIELQVNGRDLTNPSIDVTSSGTTIVVAKAKQGGEDVLMWLIGSDNAVINTTPIQVNEVPAGQLANPEVVVQGEAVVVVWNTSQGAEGKDIAARQFDVSGNPISGEKLVNVYNDGDQKHPGVVIHGSTVSIIWSGPGVTDDKGVAMRLLDIQQPGVQIVPSGSVTTESGGAVDVSVVLTSQPVGVVRVLLLSSDITEGLPTSLLLSFNATDWDTPQVFQIRGQDDPLVDGDVSYNLQVTIASTVDASYNALADQVLSLSNQDDDVPAINDVGPVSDTDPTADQIAENAALGVSVGITGFADDPDVGETVSYSISGASSGLFSIDPVSGIVTSSGALIDYESAASHSLTIRATSVDTSFSERTFSIAIIDQNDVIPVVTAGQTFLVDENAANASLVGTAVATDPDTVGSLQAWTVTGGTGQAYFGIDSVSAQITVTDSAGLNFEASTSFTLLLTVSDGTNTSVPTSVTINLSDINEVPQGANATVSAIEDTDYVFLATDFAFIDPDAGDALNRVLIDSLPASGTLILNGSALDGLTTLPVSVSSAELAGGALIYRPTTDVNGVGAAGFSVRVVDAAEQASSANTLSIDITPINDAPVIDSYGGAANSTILVDENTTAIGTVSASDPDGDSVQYFASGADVGAIAVGLNDGVITFSGARNFESPTDSDTDNDYQVTIEARDNNGGSSFQNLTVTVLDQNDTAPVVTAGQTFGTNENAANGSVLGVLAATDVDTVGSLQNWSITGGTGQSLFSVAPGSGQLSVANGAGLDFESLNNYTLTVTVSDGVTNSAAQTININVSDINDAPSGADGVSTVTEDTDYAFPIGDFGFSDPDAGDSISGIQIQNLPATGMLILNGSSLVPATGLPLTISSPELAAGGLIYRPPADQFGSGLTSFGFRVIDSAGLTSAIQSISITVTAVNDAPTVQGSRAAVVAAGGTATIEPETLHAVDLEDAASELIYTLNQAPTDGQLSLDGVSLTAGATFTQQDIDTGRLAYTSTAAADAVDRIVLTVRDSSGASSTGVEVILTSIGNGAIAPPAADSSAGSDRSERADSSTSEGGESSESGDDEESQAGVLQTVASSPPVSNNAQGSASTSSGAQEGGDLLTQNQSSAGRATGRGLASSFQEGAGYGIDAPGKDAELTELDGRGATYLSTDYRRVSNAFSQADLDQLSKHIDKERIGLLNFDQQVVASSVAVSSGLSIGYVLWLLRSGALLGSVLASIPAWRSIDPLPVLASLPGRSDDDDDESLQEMLERGRNSRDDEVISEPSDSPNG